ncbi:unnamed protein product [Protopolystoma xenopodis]|uniref:Uncharacterized protein n=1 Tax=Protopolystoma xenopodis TaxID=117903 RepID=A0A448X5S0_9PLAT|nr:unnamed protein product [Protopolystoma xenopodis]
MPTGRCTEVGNSGVSSVVGATDKKSGWSRLSRGSKSCRTADEDDDNGNGDDDGKGEDAGDGDGKVEDE